MERPRILGIEFQWISNFPDYCVGDDGSIWTCKKWNNYQYGVWRLKACRPNVKGQWCTWLNVGGRLFARSVSRLVLEAFVSPCPEGMECCHNDGNKSNNRLDNLRWDTHRNNEEDKVLHGTRLRGEQIGNHKLNENDIHTIRQLIRQGITQIQIAERFRVDQTLISNINRRKCWTWLE